MRRRTTRRTTTMLVVTTTGLRVRREDCTDVEITGLSLFAQDSTRCRRRVQRSHSLPPPRPTAKSTPTSRSPVGYAQSHAPNRGALFLDAQHPCKPCSWPHSPAACNALVRLQPSSAIRPKILRGILFAASCARGSSEPQPGSQALHLHPSAQAKNSPPHLPPPPSPTRPSPCPRGLCKSSALLSDQHLPPSTGWALLVLQIAAEEKESLVARRTRVRQSRSHSPSPCSGSGSGWPCD